MSGTKLSDVLSTHKLPTSENGVGEYPNISVHHELCRSERRGKERGMGEETEGENMTDKERA